VVSASTTPHFCNCGDFCRYHWLSTGRQLNSHYYTAQKGSREARTKRQSSCQRQSRVGWCCQCDRLPTGELACKFGNGDRSSSRHGRLELDRSSPTEGCPSVLVIHDGTSRSFGSFSHCRGDPTHVVAFRIQSRCLRLRWSGICEVDTAVRTPGL
jgi:hypothetical protein